MSLTPTQKPQIFAKLDACESGVLGLAVSGGGDSMALTALAVEWAKENGRGLAAVTVDHRLRPDSGAEAQRVQAFCTELGLPHTTLNWVDWDGQGNLQDQARRARAALIGDWARGNGIRHVATGHTQDDQAETLLMRLARGSGVDGLSAMAPVRMADGFVWVRPLLEVSRTQLRDFLASEGLPWIDDPSNEDDAFDRVKARKALDVLQGLGITREGLAQTAARMQSARQALQAASDALALKTAKVDRGDILIDWPGVSAASEETRNRLVADALMWVSGAEYRPRAKALDGLIDAMDSRKTSVLSGCQITAEGSWRRLTRELAAVAQQVCDSAAIWDGRWRLLGPVGAHGVIRALGDDGIRACPDWRESGLPRASVLASPSVWIGERLIAAPLAGFGRDWTAELIGARSRFPRQH